MPCGVLPARRIRVEQGTVYACSWTGIAILAVIDGRICQPPRATQAVLADSALNAKTRTSRNASGKLAFHAMARPKGPTRTTTPLVFFSTLT